MFEFYSSHKSQNVQQIWAFCFTCFHRLFSYLIFQFSDFEHTKWKLFQKRDVGTGIRVTIITSTAIVISITSWCACTMVTRIWITRVRICWKWNSDKIVSMCVIRREVDIAITIKPIYAVTSIMRSSVLKGYRLLVLSLKKMI